MAMEFTDDEWQGYLAKGIQIDALCEGRQPWNWASRLHGYHYMHRHVRYYVSGWPTGVVATKVWLTSEVR